MPSNRKMNQIRNQGNADGGQRFNSNVNNPIDPTNTQSPGSGRQQYPYTYIGTVKSKDDPDRMGRIAVYIREIHGKENSPHAVTWCEYASPFAGGTPTQDVRSNINYNSSQDSYGMWFPVPDIGNQVLVTFVNGDLNNGVWFACLFKQKTNAMVPEPPTTFTDNGVSVGGNPVRDTSVTNNVDTAIKPEYVPLARGLRRQGLIKDDIRGRSTSSATRQNVSTAYGIRTPRGSAITFDDGYKTDSNPNRDETSKIFDPAFISREGNRANPAKENALPSVNTPGISNRTSEFVRIRTRSGAQILVHETEGLIYMINRDGTGWVEMARDGKIDVFANDSVSVHSYGSINLTAQEDVNIEAGRNINMKARGTGTSNKERGQGNIYIESAGDTHLTTGEDMRLLIGKNQEILVANSINVRSDNWDQNVNLDYQLCICENQDIIVGQNQTSKINGNQDINVSGDRRDQVSGDVDIEYQKDNYVNIGQNQTLNIAEEYHLNVGTNWFWLTGENQYKTVGKDTYEAWPNGGVIHWGHLKEYIVPPCIAPTSESKTCEEALPELPSTPSSRDPASPDSPDNPLLAIQPLVNSLRENKTYTASISNRVPEHEPWEGHIKITPSTHEPYNGPEGNLDTIQEELAKPPSGSPAFLGSPQGGPTKGNNSPVPSIKDIDKVKANIEDAVKNPARAVSIQSAGEKMDTEITSTSLATTQPIVSQLVNDIANAASPAAIPGLITAAQSQAQSALLVPDPITGVPLLDQIVSEVESFADDITGVAKEAMEFISTDVVHDTLSVVNDTIAEINTIALDIYNGLIPEQEAIDSTLASIEGEVSGAINGLVSTVSDINISENAKEMIASFEKYVPFEFPDGFNPNGEARTAIGYGHQLSGASDDILKQFEAGLTEEEAWKVLTEKDLPAIETKVKKLLKRGIAQNQLDAFVSFAYNRGVNNPALKRAINAFNSDDVETMANEFMSNAATAGGKLIERREAEISTFFKGEYKIDQTRTELKKVALKEYIAEAWEGEHLWKNFSGYLHKEFPTEDVTKRVVQQAALVYDRSSEVSDFALPTTLPNNKLVEIVGGQAQLNKIRQQFLTNFNKINEFFGRA